MVNEESKKKKNRENREVLVCRLKQREKMKEVRA